MRIPGAFLAVLLGLGLTAMVQLPAHAQSTQSMQGMDMQAPVTHEAGVPAFHKSLPKEGVKALPPTLNPEQFSDPRVRAAYAMAAKVRKVLYQEPCYCHCDKEMGHTSLLSCYAGTHASICQTCLMEGVYTYEQTKKGKSPAQIRADIERGAWKSVNLNDLLLAHQVY
ncbi:MAG: CYCXC family (seleno)protein [Terriglobales bacterium]